jgi:hypothetical protein
MSCSAAAASSAMNSPSCRLVGVLGLGDHTLGLRQIERGREHLNRLTDVESATISPDGRRSTRASPTFAGASIHPAAFQPG